MPPPHSMLALITTLLYAAAALLLIGLSVFVLWRRPHSPLSQLFALAALSLLLWLWTLHIFKQASDPAVLTALGRANFACVLWAVLFGFLFIRELLGRQVSSARWLVAGTLVLSLLTALTPLIDRAETIAGGEHITQVGPLFALFVLQVVGYPVLAVYQAFVGRRHVSRAVAAQLEVVGLGILLTVTVGAVTAIVLPYGFHIFAYEEIGALSTVTVPLAIAYAITFQHLFDARVVIRKALVIALLIALAEWVYSQSITQIVERLPTDQNSAVLRQLISLATVLFIAVSFAPCKRWLERQIDRLFFARRPKHGSGEMRERS